jgi:hypothetical protein
MLGLLRECSKVKVNFYGSGVAGVPEARWRNMRSEK